MSLLIGACSDSNDVIEEVVIIDNGPEVVETNEFAGINNFIYTGMSIYYRWKDNVPGLANDRFSSNEEYNAYLQASGTPEGFLETLVYNRETVDRDSRVETDYKESLANLQGDLGTNGVDFGLALYGDNKVLGYVRLILPGSDEDGKDIKRGDLFTEVDGRELTIENYRGLLFSDNPTYTGDSWIILNLEKRSAMYVLMFQGVFSTFGIGIHATKFINCKLPSSLTYSGMREKKRTARFQLDSNGQKRS